MHAGIPPAPGTRHPPPGADPPGAEHAGRYGQRVGGMHPTGMQSCLYSFRELLAKMPARDAERDFTETSTSISFCF